MAKRHTLIAQAKAIIKRIDNDGIIINGFCLDQVEEVTAIFSKLGRMCANVSSNCSNEDIDKLSPMINPVMKDFNEFNELRKKFEDAFSMHSQVFEAMLTFKAIHELNHWPNLTRKHLLELRTLLEKDERVAKFRDSACAEELKKEFENGNFAQRANKGLEVMTTVYQILSMI